MKLFLHPAVAFHAVEAGLAPSVLDRLDLALEVPILAIFSDVLVLLGVPAVVLEVVGVAAPAPIMAA